MRRLWTPAIAVMNRLSYPQKFALVSLLFVIPLALAMLSLISDADSGVQIVQKERQGTRYLRPLRQFLSHVIEASDRAAAFDQGDIAAHTELVHLKTLIDADFQAVKAIDAETGQSFATGEYIASMEEDWKLIVQDIDSGQPVPGAAFYSQLIERTRNLISQVGDASNLILAPQLDSYYTVDALVNRLPEIQAQLAQARLVGQDVLINKTMSPTQQAQLALFEGLLSTDKDALVKNITIIFHNDTSGHIEADLASPLSSFSGTITAVVSTLYNGFLDSSRSPLSPQDYNSTISTSLDSSFAFWDRTIGELDTLLQARSDSLTQKKMILESITIGLLIVVTYLLVAFYLSVMRTVSTLGQASQRMVNGEEETAVHIESRDELGRVVASFNRVASALINASAALRQRQETSAAISSRMVVLSDELKATATQQASGSVEQAAAVAQINQTVAELAKAAEHIAELAEVVNEAASAVAEDSTEIAATTRLSAQRSEKGMEAVQQVVEVSREGAEFYRQLHETMERLAQKSGNMRSILRLLEEIASQTHLVALNASIEAAGAGMYGQRFGVVAEEIQLLATRSSASSKDVVKIVQEIEKGIQATVLMAGVGYQTAQRIEEAAGQAGAVIQDMLTVSSQAEQQAAAITTAAQAVQQRLALIKVASAQQRTSSVSVLNALQNLRQVAQQIEAGSADISTTATSLDDMSRSLSEALTATATI